MATRDYYAVLGVASSTTHEEIRKKYFELAKRYHPDRNPGNKAAENRFKEINEAYEVLSDAKKRKDYDQIREFEAHGRSAGGDGDEGLGLDLGEMLKGGMDGLGGLFDRIFGRRGSMGAGGPPFGTATGPGGAPGAGHGGAGGPDGHPGSGRAGAGGGERGSYRPEDLHFSISIPFEIAARGGKTIIAVPSEENCTTCKGTGATPGTPVRPCGACEGTGQMAASQGGFSLSRPCRKCLGRGRLVASPCARCRGQGIVRGTSKLAITIPPGIAEGSDIRVKGQGLQLSGGAPRGDLYLKVSIEDHPQMRREGKAVVGAITINVVQAILGTQVEVGTVSGETIALRIPPGTQPGTRLRLKGKGILGGDHLVEIKVAIPQDLTPKDRDGLAAWAKNARLPL